MFTETGTVAVPEVIRRISSQARREGGGKEGRLPQGLVLWGASDLRAWFLRIPQNALKTLIANETLFGA